MNKPRTLSIDLETYSSVDIGKCGAYKYVESDDFEILLFAYSCDYGPVTVIDMTRNDGVPTEIVDWLYDPEVEKTAFNANFERTCLSKWFGRYCEPEQWSCTMILSASCGLPLSLAGVGAALELPEDKAKMKEGKELIRYFCQPCKSTKANGGRTRNRPEDAPEKWATFVEYNRRDVETENTIRQRLLKWRPDFSEQKLWCLDQRMNDKGVRIEPKLAENAIRIGDQYRDELIAHCKQLTGLENPNSTAQIKQWLEEQEGIEVLSLNKKAIADVYASLSEDQTKEVLKLREEFSKSSNKKYEAFLRSCCEDNHVRGTFQFYGASTGRWAGRLVQLQNLPHDTLPDLDDARALALLGDEEDFECFYPKVQTALSALIRTMIIPEENSRLIVADFSAIEARVIAWIANEEWRIQAFANGEDIYCASASRAFKVPVVKHGINGELRAKGKIIELACIAEDQLVLTDHGLVPIQDVTTEMRVWDGEDWVEHEGVIYKGVKDVYEYEGLTATADHLVFVEGQPEPIHFGVAAACGAHLIQTGDGWNTIWLGENNRARKEMERELESLLRSYGMHWVWIHRLDESECNNKWQISWLSELLRSTAQDPALARQETDLGETEMRESEGQGIQELRSERHQVRISECDNSGGLDDRQSGFTGSEYGDRQNRYERGLCSGESPLGYPQDELYKSEAMCVVKMGSAVLAIFKDSSDPETIRGLLKGANYSTGSGCCIRQEKELARYKGKARVYDIRNAGRHHRYTVSGKLVHNCGYGGGVGAMKNFGADRMGMKEDEMSDLVAKWREASPHIVALWKSLEDAAIRCIKRGKPTISTVGHIRFDLEDGVMWMSLPSGRRIAYWGAAMGQDRWGRPSMTYMSMNQTTRKWERTETFGGKLTENLIQATARDCLKEALFNLDKAGYDVRATVHDEVIITDPYDHGTLEEAIQLMCKGAPWMEGLPLNADGYYCSSYRKD